MNYRFLILDTYYWEFLQTFYGQRPDLMRASYDEQLQALLGSCFGTSDFYSSALRTPGHEAHDLIVNCVPLQHQWAAENMGQLHSRPGRGYLTPTLTPGEVSRIDHGIIRAQIEAFKPDILYVQNLTILGEEFLRDIKPMVRMLVGQTASALTAGFNYNIYDLVLTSFPHYVQMFRDCGVACEYVKLAFEPRVLEHVGRTTKSFQHDIAFVGGYTVAHRQRIELLEQLGRALPVDYWGYGVDELSDQSPVRHRYHGEAWGLQMYQILGQSRIVVNRHVNVAGRFANNMRLYEATGMGALLLTDYKDNLSELFEIGREVVAYRSAEECIELARYYLRYESERLVVAREGQQRTLTEHTYAHRAAEMESIITDYWNGKASPQPIAEAVRGRPRLPVSGSVPKAVSPLAKGMAMTKQVVRKVPGLRTARRLVRQIVASGRSSGSSSGRRIISAAGVSNALTHAWKSPDIPERQRKLVDTELKRMYEGDTIPVYRILAEAVQATGQADGQIIEVGCASGYYSEVLAHLLQRPINYVGIDYSAALIAQARRYYPETPFVVGDVCALPLPDGASDVLISGAVLLHVPDYTKAIAETARVTRRWVIFHRTPVIHHNPTTYYAKLAYGVLCVELAFNERELLNLFEQVGLGVEHTWAIDIGVEGAIEPEVGKTYLCRKGFDEELV